MPAVKDLVKDRIKSLDDLVKQLKQDSQEGDFEGLAQTADDLANEADDLSSRLHKAASAFGDEDEEEAVEDALEEDDEDNGNSKSKK
jgi:hypothetical protein